MHKQKGRTSLKEKKPNYYVKLGTDMNSFIVFMNVVLTSKIYSLKTEIIHLDISIIL